MQTKRMLVGLSLLALLLGGCAQPQKADLPGNQESSSVEAAQNPSVFLSSLTLSDVVVLQADDEKNVVAGTLSQAGEQQVSDYCAAVLAADDTAELRDDTTSSALEITIDDTRFMLTQISDLESYLEVHADSKRQCAARTKLYLQYRKI